MHGRAGTHRVQIGALGRILARVLLRNHEDRLVLAQRLDQLNRTLATHGHRLHLFRKQHLIPHRQNRIGVPAALARKGLALGGADNTYKFIRHC